MFLKGLKQLLGKAPRIVQAAPIVTTAPAALANTIIKVWVKLLKAAPNSSRFTELGIDKITNLNQSNDIADLRQTLLDHVAFRNELQGIDSSKLQVYKNDADAGDPGKALNVRKKLETLKESNGEIDVVVVAPPKPDQSRPATTIQLIQQTSVPTDRIEKELEIIFQGVNHQLTRPIDPKDVEASQRSILGPFYKRNLPYYTTATDISLVKLGLELGKHARDSNGETLYEIVKKDIGGYNDHRVVAMVAPSGSGKTATVIDLASKHFVIYCVCCIPNLISPGFNDPNFITLAKDVESMYRTIVNRNQGSLRDPLDIDSEVKALAEERVNLEFLARMLFLQYLLKNNPDLEPQQFFREQITGGALTIGRLVRKLQDYDNGTIQDMLNEVQAKLQLLLSSKGLGLVIALDEAQIAATKILSGKLISPAALDSNKNTLFDDKNQIQFRYRRGFLTPLSNALSTMQATLVILGTSLSLQDAEHVYTAIAKKTNFSRITNFPSFNEDDVSRLFLDLIDMSGCEIPLAKRRMLTGRSRFSVDVINHLAASCAFKGSKQAILDHAIDKSIKHTINGLRAKIRAILANDQAGGIARLLSRMVLAYHLHSGKISFSGKDQSDFVDKALCKLRPHSDGIHLIMDEPIVVEAVQEELKALGKDPVFSEYMDQFNRIIANFGIASTSKGDALEPLVRRSLQRFNGYRLVDLPFLQGVTLPTWCSNFQLQIDEIKTANGFGYTGNGVRADLAFLTECPPNKMLIANNGTRPDGVWFFSDKRYAGSLAIKLYSNRLKQSTHYSNKTSSNIRNCFLKQDGINVNPSLTGVRRDFKASGTPSNLRGILRIHLEFPGVEGGNPVTHIKKNPATGIEDVMVYINLLNLDDFFFEGIAENKDDMAKLKKLIKFVSSSK